MAVENDHPFRGSGARQHGAATDDMPRVTFAAEGEFARGNSFDRYRSFGRKLHGWAYVRRKSGPTTALQRWRALRQESSGATRQERAERFFISA